MFRSAYKRVAAPLAISLILTAAFVLAPAAAHAKEGDYVIRVTPEKAPPQRIQIRVEPEIVEGPGVELRRVRETGPMGYNYGFGAYGGEPTGLTFKWWLAPKHALDFQAGYSWAPTHSFAFFADYLYTPVTLRTRPINVPFYIGGGAFGGLGENEGLQGGGGTAYLGLRVPIGFSIYPRNTRLDFFAQVAPGVVFWDGADFSFDGQIGARFYF